MADERYKYSVYVYSKGYDGTLELMNLQSFDEEGLAKGFFDRKKSDIREGLCRANCVELNKDIYLGDDLFMSTSVNIEHFERRVDFAV